MWDLMGTFGKVFTNRVLTLRVINLRVATERKESLGSHI